jgi:hypothetical protein
MAIRKSIAAGLMVAATALAKDQSKEKLQVVTDNLRRKLAKAIEPKN